MLFEQVNIVPSVKAHRLGKTKGVPTFVANTKLGTARDGHIPQITQVAAAEARGVKAFSVNVPMRKPISKTHNRLRG